MDFERKIGAENNLDRKKKQPIDVVPRAEVQNQKMRKE
jgi:hypothetical protein